MALWLAEADKSLTSVRASHTSVRGADRHGARERKHSKALQRRKRGLRRREVCASEHLELQFGFEVGGSTPLATCEGDEALL